MTTKESEFQERLKASLEKANETLKLKNRIDADISSVLSILKELTSDSIDFEISQNIPIQPKFKDCKRIVRLKRKSQSSYSDGFILFGYSINESTGYPMQIETETEVDDCVNVDDLKESIVYVIEQKSIDIMKLISEDTDDIPF
ncbi:hypothetical protein O3H74_25850 [Escherichia coli]|uniref:hypothetical protein n=1 Tax=Escherichia coli TaxID=562 RepID=UPI0002BC652A|nr:hypothetical protein [Salmonella enterica subsp. enterica serovar Newport]HEC9045887.1 hypothetical protein [Salmonella enterica subsp. enterica serovar Newport]